MRTHESTEECKAGWEMVLISPLAPIIARVNENQKAGKMSLWAKNQSREVGRESQAVSCPGRVILPVIPVNPRLPEK